MSNRKSVPPSVMVLSARKVQEALGLLNMLKPLCQRPGKLTEAELEVFYEITFKVSCVLSEAWRCIHEAQYPRTIDPADYTPCTEALSKSPPLRKA